MLTEDFFFDLPKHLIAQTPPMQRGDSRLMLCDAAGQQIRDTHFSNLPEQLNAGDLLIFNDTKVIPARLYGEKQGTGGKLELLVERIAEPHSAWCHIKASRSPRPGAELLLAQRYTASVQARDGALSLVALAPGEDFLALLEECGSTPLPPYIDREADGADAERYQTVYAHKPGAVAAPTAGLHFDRAMLGALAAAGIEMGFVTLHVGAGTFSPIRVQDPRQHTMHAERVEVGEKVCAQIDAARARGGRVVAVGTTVVRSLESATHAGVTRPFSGETAIFITPGFHFGCVDLLLTNFHLPRSTLLMLVCAFAGQAFMLEAYRHAVAQQYRFFSYGDAMLVHSAASARGRAEKL